MIGTVTLDQLSDTMMEIARQLNEDMEPRPRDERVSVSGALAILVTRTLKKLGGSSLPEALLVEKFGEILDQGQR